MRPLLLLVLAATPPPPPATTLELRENGVTKGNVRALNFVGPASVYVDGGVGRVFIDGGGSAAGYSTIQNKGSPLTQRTTLNFTGYGITCTDSGGVTVCTVVGSDAGTPRYIAANIDFTSVGNSTASTSVAATWATASSIIDCNPTGVATVSRAEGAEDAILEGLQCQISNRSAGVGFTLKCSPRQGLAYGVYAVHCSGGEP